MHTFLFPILALFIIAFFNLYQTKENFEATQESTPVSLSQFNSLKSQVTSQEARIKKIEKSMKKVNGMMGELEK